MSPGAGEHGRRGRAWVGWTLVAGLTSLAFGVRLRWFLTTDEPLGWDGYAFVVQVERLVAAGRLHWPDASWVTYLFGALHLLFPSPVVAVKVGSCLLAAAAVPAAFALGRALEEDLAEDASSRAGWLSFGLATWAAASPTLTHLAGDFPKSLGAVAPLLLALGWRRARWRSRLLRLVLLVLVAAVAHRLGAALLLAAGGGALGAAMLSRTSLRRGALVGLSVLAAFVVLSAALPNLLHPADLDRLEAQLTFTPRGVTPLSYFALRATAWSQRLELILCWPALAWGAWAAWRVPGVRVRAGAFLAPLVVCVFPLWRTDVLDVGYRLVLMAPLFAAPLWAVGLAVLARPVVREASGSGGPTGRRGVEGRGALAGAGWRRGPSWWLAATALVVALAPTGMDPRAGPPVREWRAVIERIPPPLPELLIAPQGMNFLYDHLTGHESLAYAPEPELDRTRIFRLAFGVRDGEWLELAADAEPAPRRLGADVVYVREDVWERFRARALADDDDDLRARVESWRNPGRVRPRSLRRNH